MAIKKTDLQRYSSEILEFFERGKITSFGELEKKIGDSFRTSEGHICLEIRPSSALTVLTLSYISPSKGIPIEIGLNRTYGYSDIIIRSKDEIADYNPTYSEFSSSLSGNIFQNKRIACI